jgi:hypothetical protein
VYVSDHPQIKTSFLPSTYPSTFSNSHLGIAYIC